MKKLEDRVSIGTGAGSGFGRSIALRLASKKAKIAIFDVKQELARAVAEKIGAEFSTIEPPIGGIYSPAAVLRSL